MTAEEYQAVIAELEEQRNVAFTRCTVLARKVYLLRQRLAAYEDTQAVEIGEAEPGSAQPPDK